MITIICLNDATLTWEYALNDLMEMQNSNLGTFRWSNHLSVEELLNVGNTLQETSAVSFEELHLHLPDRFTTIASSKAVPRQLASHFPVIIVSNEQHSFLINLYQLTFDYPELNSLFEIKEPVSEEPVDPGPQAKKLPSRNGGRKSFITLIPGLAEEVTRFIKSQGFKAQERRRFNWRHPHTYHGQISLVEGTRNKCTVYSLSIQTCEKGNPRCITI